MSVVVTRPQADSERSAAALRARGHTVLVAPLMATVCDVALVGVNVILVGFAASVPPPLVGVQLDEPTVTVTFAVVVMPFALT